MEESRFVRVRRDYPIPAVGSKTRLLNMVGDLIDDSLRFLDEELRCLRVPPSELEASKDRLKKGLISEWALWVLDREIPDVVTEDDVRDFLKGKCGVGPGVRESQVGGST